MRREYLIRIRKMAYKSREAAKKAAEIGAPSLEHWECGKYQRPLSAYAVVALSEVYGVPEAQIIREEALYQLAQGRKPARYAKTAMQRARIGMKQATLARETRIGEPRLRKIERGDAAPTKDERARIAKALGMRPEDVDKEETV